MAAKLFEFLSDYPANHWRGGHSLLLTLLVTVVGLRVLTSALLPVLSDARGTFVVAAWIAANGAILLWQAIGTWRAIERHLEIPADTMAAWGGYFTILVAAVLTVIQTVDGVTTFAPAPRTKAVKSPAMVLPISADGRSITLAGNLDYDLNAALEAALAQNAGIARIVLGSVGGNIFAARAVAINITRLQLDTHVDGKCYSACTLAFMAGRHRTLGPEGRLGFHQYVIPGELRVKILDIEAEQLKDRNYLASRGITEEFLR